MTGVPLREHSRYNTPATVLRRFWPGVHIHWCPLHERYYFCRAQACAEILEVPYDGA